MYTTPIGNGRQYAQFNEPAYVKLAIKSKLMLGILDDFWVCGEVWFYDTSRYSFWNFIMNGEEKNLMYEQSNTISIILLKVIINTCF